VAVEAGVVRLRQPDQPIRIDTPAGTVTAYAVTEGGRLTGIRFHNVPSYAAALDQLASVPGVGAVRYDLAFGGAFYAYVDAAAIGLACTPGHYQALIAAGKAIKRAVAAAGEPQHPDEPDLGFLYGTVFTGPPQGPGADVRNVCVFADGEVDRSPTGTSVSAQLALARARGRLPPGGTLVFESIIGTRFTGRVVSDTRVGPYPGIIPEVQGSAHITGRHEFVLDPKDPIAHGFLLR
jgi:trans-L-3-hydroxyproline dehydratase